MSSWSRMCLPHGRSRKQTVVCLPNWLIPAAQISDFFKVFRNVMCGDTLGELLVCLRAMHGCPALHRLRVWNVPDLCSSQCHDSRSQHRGVFAFWCETWFVTGMVCLDCDLLTKIACLGHFWVTWALVSCFYDISLLHEPVFPWNHLFGMSCDQDMPCAIPPVALWFDLGEPYIEMESLVPFIKQVILLLSKTKVQKRLDSASVFLVNFLFLRFDPGAHLPSNHSGTESCWFCPSLVLNKSKSCVSKDPRW